MADQKPIGSWVEGCVVERIAFKDGLVLNLDGYNELVIPVPFRLHLPATAAHPAEAVTIDPLSTTAAQKPLFDFAGTHCTRFSFDDDGALRVEFASGHRIEVSPAAGTAWELYCKYHGYAACLGHGNVRVVRHGTFAAD